MKKSFLILLLPLLLAGCNNGKTEEHTCVDSNKDHLCDVCQKRLSYCEDKDEDGKCDVCGKDFVPTEVGITIKKVPNKTKYYVGDKFDPEGMVVNVVYSDGKFAPITGYNYSSEPLKLTDKEVVISYKEFSEKVSIEVISKDKPAGEITQTIILSGNEFGAVAKNAGVQFDDSSYSRNVETLFQYCDNQFDFKGLISSISCTNLNTCEWEKGAALCIGTGYYGKDRFKPGSFTWNSELKIYKVEVEAQAYYKANNYDGDIVDTYACLHLDDVEKNLIEDSEIIPSIKKVSKEYQDGVNKFTLSSTGGRVAIKQITITWRG